MGDLVTYNIELDANDLKLIGKLLDTQPYGEVAKLVSRMQRQINEQEARAAQQRELEQDIGKWGQRRTTAGE
jgi:hypothetical protein